MSQDLLAAFEDPWRDAPKPVQHTHSATGPDLSTLSIEDDDDFGDFEDAQAHSPQKGTSHPNAWSTSDSQVSLPVAPTSDHVPTITPAGRLPFVPKVKPTPSDGRTGRHPFADHMDVLFAADDNEYDAGQDEWQDLSNNPEAAMAYSKKIIQQQLEAQASWDARDAPLGVTPQQTRSPVPIRAIKQEPAPELRPRNLDVLFDADDLSDEAPEENDLGAWGDFEGSDTSFQQLASTSIKERRAIGKVLHIESPIEPPVQAQKTGPTSFDLLGLEETSVLDDSLLPTPELERRPEHLEPRKPLARSPNSWSKIITQGIAIDSAWDDFDETIPSSTTAVMSATPPTSNFALKIRRPSMPSIPPQNVPPPSVLLSTFPDLLKKPLSQATVDDRIVTATVLAHIIAGRKQRWKRSSALAASMRIGPAAAGGKGGMKLTGLDRNESTREDREVAEVLSAWRAQLGKLRSVYSAHTSAGATTGKLLQAKLPELHDPAPVRVLKAGEGGLVAMHECALCGLRRNERVNGVDDAVEDTFGEWWIEGANMHSFCAAWWAQHEVLLRSR